MTRKGKKSSLVLQARHFFACYTHLKHNRAKTLLEITYFKAMNPTVEMQNFEHFLCTIIVLCIFAVLHLVDASLKLVHENIKNAKDRKALVCAQYAFGSKAVTIATGCANMEAYRMLHNLAKKRALNTFPFFCLVPRWLGQCLEVALILHA